MIRLKQAHHNAQGHYRRTPDGHPQFRCRNAVPDPEGTFGQKTCEVLRWEALPGGMVKKALLRNDISPSGLPPGA